MSLQNKFLMGLAKWSFSSKRADFYADLAEALEDRAVLVDQIKILEKQARVRKDVILPIYQLWLYRLDDRSFSQSLLGTVPDSDVMVLEAAEESGAMIEGLRFLSKSIVASNKMRSVLRQAVAGPAFFGLLFIAMLCGYSYFLVPILVQIMKPSTWPMVGKVLYTVAQIVTGYGIWLGIIGILVLSLYLWSLKRWTGKWRSRFDNYVPLYSIYRDFNGSIFLVSLASLMQSGMGLSESLRALARRATPWMRWHINRIQLRLDSEADQPYKAFDTGIFNRTLMDRIINFGSRNEVVVAFTKVGLSSIDKLTEFMAAAATVLNRVLILLCGAAMMFMITGTLLTAQEAQTAIRAQAFVK